MKRSKKVLGIAVLAVLAALMLFAYTTFRETPAAGSKRVTIQVVDDTGATVAYEVKTDAAYLQQAMEAAEGLTFAYTEGPYGASVHTVNGLRADYELDGAYWGFFVNGDYCNYGIAQQPLEDGDVFQIVYTSV